MLRLLLWEVKGREESASGKLNAFLAVLLIAAK
jgi:hypothetical protein